MASGKEIQLYNDIGKSQPVYPKTNAKCVFYDDGTRLDRMIAAARPRNLLINSDFTNPVNRKGQTSYAGNAYSIDRWNGNGNIDKVTVNDGYITVSAKSGANGFFRQYYELRKMLGKTVTMAIWLRDGSVYVGSGTYPASAPAAGSGDVNVLMFSSAEFNLYINANNANASAQIRLNNGTSLDIKWMALYEGEYTIDTLPEYQPKGYEQELLICNQYDPNTGEYIGLRRFGQPHNLLDNSDFRNPVNQRGKTSYSAQGYTIDKWLFRTNGGGESATIEAAGIRLTKKLDATNYTALKQPFNVADQKMAGKTVTFVANIIEASNSFRLRITGAASETADSKVYAQKILDTPGIHFITCTLPNPLPNNYLSTVVNLEDVGTILIGWTALYEGVYSADTLPEYQPKGKQVEALNCGAIPGPIDLLWENASPASEFAAQTVAVDLSLYSWCAIETYHSTTEVASTVDFMPVKEGVQYAVDVVDSNDNTARRPFTISKTGIVFDGAKRSGSATTKYVIPVRIYGVKG